MSLSQPDTSDAAASGAAGTIDVTAGEALNAGDVVAIFTDGEAYKASATTSSSLIRAIGVSTETVLIGATVTIQTGQGEQVNPTFAAAPGAAANGVPVYVSTVAGEATLTLPTGPLVTPYEIGILRGGNGVTVTPDVILSPHPIQTVTGASATFDITSAATIAIGDVVGVDTAGDAVLASATTALERFMPIGVATTAATAGNPVSIQPFDGRNGNPTYDSTPGAAANSDDVWLSTTLGRATLSPSVASGTSLVLLGTLQGADGATTTPSTALYRQHVSDT